MKRLTLLALAVVLGAPSFARAAPPPILREGTHPMWAGMGMGPAIEISDYVTQFKLTPQFGYHFSGRAEGPAVAVELQLAFGDGTTFGFVPMFVWDFRIVPGLGLYISPFVGLGYAGFFPDCPPGFDCDGAHGLTFQFGVKAKLVLGDRGYVFFQPVAFDIMAAEYSVYVGGPFGGRYVSDWDDAERFDMLFGGGVIF
jgi:hypothetical protein